MLCHVEMNRALEYALRYPRCAMWHAHRALAAAIATNRIDLERQATALIVALSADTAWP